MMPDWEGPASPEMNQRLRARMEQLLGEYERVRDNASAVQEKLRSARGEAQSKDGTVKVTVGPRGDLLDLRIEPRAYRRLSPSELAAEILDLAGRATRDAQGQVEEVMAPFLPEGVTYADAVSGQASPASWVPRGPLSPDTLDDWLARIGKPPSRDPDNDRGLPGPG